jgi:hypothetical protein
MKLYKNILIVFGVLDLISLILNFNLLKESLLNISTLPIFSYFQILLIISLLFSSVFSILKKKTGILIYYGQFGFRIAFFILSIGFIMKFSYHSVLFYILGVFVFIFELFRLIYSILLHKKKLV